MMDLPTVVFPQPLSPTRPRVSPGLILKDTSSTAFSGTVLNNPILMGKYCFRFCTSTRYSAAMVFLLPAFFCSLLHVEPAGRFMGFTECKLFRHHRQTHFHGTVASAGKSTPRWHVENIDGCPRNGLEPLLDSCDVGYGIQKPLGGFMGRIIEYIICSAPFTYASAVQHDDF